MWKRKAFFTPPLVCADQGEDSLSCLMGVNMYHAYILCIISTLHSTYIPAVDLDTFLSSPRLKRAVTVPNPPSPTLGLHD